MNRHMETIHDQRLGHGCDCSACADPIIARGVFAGPVARCHAHYLVIGSLDGNPVHEFAETDSYTDARNIWASHDGVDGPVYVFSARDNRQVFPA